MHVKKLISTKISVAPMMGYTDRHARYLYRLISPAAKLYTEMVIDKAVIHGNRQKLLAFNAAEQPLVLQLGGSDPSAMATAARIAEDCGFSEININVGCPSDRVQSGKIGACLMRDPDIVAECVKAMRESVDIPVTVKTRTGVDELDDYGHLSSFVNTVGDAGCSTFIVHARKAWLKGLSPKENRDVPPLDYQRVYQLKSDYPNYEIVINGGIISVAEVEKHLRDVDGVMIGREITRNPWLLSEIDIALKLSDTGQVQRDTVLKKYSEYMGSELELGTSVHLLVKPISGMFHGIPGARAWRKLLADVSQGRVGNVSELPRLLSAFS